MRITHYSTQNSLIDYMSMSVNHFNKYKLRVCVFHPFTFMSIFDMPLQKGFITKFTVALTALYHTCPLVLFLMSSDCWTVVDKIKKYWLSWYFTDSVNWRNWRKQAFIPFPWILKINISIAKTWNELYLVIYF